MEEEEKQSTYQYDITDDKHFFVGYLNLAENNIYRAMKSCYKRFHLKKSKDKKDLITNYYKFITSIINRLFPDNLGVSVFEERVEYLKNIFPFVRYIYLDPSHTKIKNEIDQDKARIQYFKSSFLLLFKLLHDLRNFYTHYFNRPWSVSDIKDKKNSAEEDTFKLINHILLTSAIHVYKRKKKMDITKEALKDGLKEEWAELSKLKIEDLKKKKKENKRINLNDKEGINNAIFNDAFSSIFFINKKNNSEELKDRYQSIPNDWNKSKNGNIDMPISQNAFIFFLCLFLNKKQGNDLRSLTKGFKRRQVPINEITSKFNSLTMHATHWVYSELAFKEVKGKINTAFDTETLLSQIVDYLGKVPDEVYQVLDAKQQKEFQFNMNATNTLPNNEEDSMDIIEPSIRKRFENKFNYFALKFLDNFVFKKIKLQVVLGKYTHNQQEKKIFGTDKFVNRVISEKIKIFERLNKIRNLKNDFFNNISSEDPDFHLEEYPRPYYNIQDNKIPIYFSSKKQIKSKSQRNEGKISKSEILDKLDPASAKINQLDYRKKSPTAILSLNELPALLHYFFTEINKIDKGDKVAFGKVIDNLENKIIKKYEIIFDAIKNFDPEKPPTSVPLPKTLFKATNGLKINFKKLLNALKNEVSCLEERLKNLEESKKEKRERDKKYNTDSILFSKKELGENVEWLAHTIIRVMPEENRKNWKGYQHNHLKSCLSKFNYNKKEAFDTLNNCWFFDRQTDPWSEMVKKLFNNKRSIEDLYESFIVKKKEEFTILIDNFIDEGLPNKIINKFIKQRYLWRIFKKRDFTTDNLENLKIKFLKKPLLLPRGLFDEKPTYIKGKSIEENPQEFAAWFVYLNKTREYQSFYNYDRHYSDLFEQSKIDNDTIKKNKKGLSLADRIRYFKDRYDKKIQTIQWQDLFLMEMVNFLMKEVSSTMTTINSLKDFYQPIVEDGDNDSQSVWNQKIKFKEGQIEDEVKLKDCGKFKNFLLDEKVEKIFSYNKGVIWNWEKLNNELLVGEDSYEYIRRERLFKLIHQLEKEILEKYEAYTKDDEHPIELGEVPNFQKYLEVGIEEEPQIIAIITKIRNCFAHNDLLEKKNYDDIKTTQEEKDEKTISKLIYNYALERINRIL